MLFLTKSIFRGINIDIVGYTVDWQFIPGAGVTCMKNLRWRLNRAKTLVGILLRKTGFGLFYLFICFQNEKSGLDSYKVIVR